MGLRSINLITFWVVAVTACSSPSREWVKPGGSAEDLRLARDQCSSQSGSYDFAFDDRFTGRQGVIDNAPSRQSRAGSAQGDVYRDCMQDRGWRRERVVPDQQPK